MASSSSSYGSSFSDPSLLQSPESDWGMQLSGLLASLGSNQYAWAMDQFNKGMGVTNKNIDQYLDLAGKGAGLAQNLLSRYEDQFEPLMDSFIRQAGTYNSEARQKFMMGQAESTVGQADEAARSEAERKLQGFGINPNSGRYQDLMLTGRIQDAAARAGAGTQASLNTAAIGRQMTQQAAQMGQNVPGMTVNALQSAYTGVTGAENALLGMLNTGANLTQSAAPFFNAASGAIKMPPVGNKSQQQNRASSMQLDPGSSSGGRSNNQGPGNQGSGQNPGKYSDGDKGKAWMPEHGNGSVTIRAPQPVKKPPTDQGWDQYNKDTGKMLDDAEANPEWMRETPNLANEYKDKGTGEDVDPQFPGGMDPWDPQTYVGAGGSPWWADKRNPDMTPGPLVPDFNGNWDQGQTPQTGVTDPNMPPGPQQWNANKPNPNDGTDPWDLPKAENPLANVGNWRTPQNDQQKQIDDFVASERGQEWANRPDYLTQGGQWNGSDLTNQEMFPNYPQEQEQANAYQEGGDNGNWWDQYNQNNGIEQQPEQDYSGWGSGAQQQDFSQPDYSDWGSSGAGNMGPTGPSGDDSYGDDSYARGGRVRPGVLPSTGGPVPRGASPSRGRQTDDIPARLNAGEFVVPRDVVAHKGTEFFKKLIEGSRKMRTGMGGPPAKPTMKPGLRLNPTFVSRGM